MSLIIRTLFLFTIYFHCVNSNLFISDLNSSPSVLEECTLLCEQSQILETKKEARLECCSRGCRFYGIAALITVNKHHELNISKESCYSCCFESYTGQNDKGACNIGCDMMAKRHKILLMSAAEVAFSSIVQEEEVGLIIDSGDLMDSEDFLTDLAVRHYLGAGDKLPEMRVKTLPVNRDVMVRGEWWSDCSAHKAGISRCLAASLLVLLILLVLWFALSCDDKATLPSPTLLLSAEAPPLPSKYSLHVDITA